MNNSCCKSTYIVSLFIPKIRFCTMKIKIILSKCCFLTLKITGFHKPCTLIRDSIGLILAQCKFSNIRPQENLTLDQYPELPSKHRGIGLLLGSFWFVIVTIGHGTQSLADTKNNKILNVATLAYGTQYYFPYYGPG